ncbi:hypothetical protein BXO88_08625 [Oribacterium sp. C9]|uniref:glycosyltransferase family protein n=1 Tax=Oribacterium sp. C9 TaxID=1943579 RepID=UPI00098FDD87|nr:glycosyltransferase [Oribacterium sp. C9]OON86106.1 hypothetical protein BXO88_08625 [Oribacterium sp. C9]
MRDIIVCSVSKSYNDLVNYFTGHWVKALKKIPDVHVKEVYVDEIHELDKEFMEMIQGGNCSMLCYNNFGLLLLDASVNLWEMYGVDVYDFLLDHPRNYDDSLENPINTLHVICLDQNHVDFVKRFYPKVKEVIYLPDSGVKEGDIIKPFHERSMDVLYCGNCQEVHEYLMKVDYLPNNGMDMYEAAIGMLIEDPDLSAEEAVERYLKENELKSDNEMLYDLLVTKHVSRYIEDIVRREYKLMIMHALDMAGISVDVYGTGWVDEEKPFSDNIRIHNRVSPYECHKLVGDAKIDLSIMPWFKKGSSEKPFAGMMNGAVCVSDTSTYLEENYMDGIDIMLFDLNHIEKAVQDIMWLLSNPKEAEIIAMNGHHHVMEHDGTEARIKQLLEIMRKDQQY